MFDALLRLVEGRASEKKTALFSLCGNRVVLTSPGHTGVQALCVRSEPFAEKGSERFMSYLFLCGKWIWGV